MANEWPLACAPFDFAQGQRGKRVVSDWQGARALLESQPMDETTSPSTSKKPRLALLIATGFGLGYLPKAPGTWGSLAGLALAWCIDRGLLLFEAPDMFFGDRADALIRFLPIRCQVALVLAFVGFWAADRAVRVLGGHDPRQIVIDEISGQQIAFVAAGAVGWKYLLAGFILFRVFDIWKPFPARRVEKFAGGWGIMADDWVAGIYAALVLWVARELGL